MKVLDFGLAKALDPAPDVDPSLSPTLTAAATQMGVILGTAAYMSPEQAKGKPVDHRSDLWAFGVVLLEMLTGRQVFPGPTVSESLAKVLERGPDLDTLPSGSPPAVRRLLRRCLTKDRRERQQHAGDARVELIEAMTRPEADAVVASVTPPPGRQRDWQTAAIVGVVAAAVAAVATYTVGRRTGDIETTSAEFRRLVLPLDLEQRRLSAAASRSFAIAPDGATVVFAMTQTLGEPLYRRDLDGVETIPIPGTEGGSAPFFSPDGRWVGFYRTAESTPYRVSLAGGEPELVAATSSVLLGASWGPDDTIVFATAGTPGLMRVPAVGGTPTQITTTAENEVHGRPHHLPAGNRLLFTISESRGLPRIAAVSSNGGDAVELGIQGREPRYLSVGSAGYLVYGQTDGLVAVPFDAETLSVNGVPVSVLSPVWMVGDSVNAAFASDGTAVALEPLSGVGYQPTWVERDGSASPVGGLEPSADLEEVRLSRDGRRVALSDRTRSGSLRVYDLETSELFTFDVRAGIYLSWNPEGTRLAFSSNQSGQLQLYTVDVSGTGRAVPLVETEDVAIAGSWSADGNTLFFYQNNPETNRDLYAYAFDDGGITRLLATPTNEHGPMVSPDGRWLAYLSDTSGSLEVHVSSLPGFEVTRQVSHDGGREPSWSATGDELFYRSGGGAMVAVSFRATPELSLGRPQELFRDEFVREPFGIANYGIAPDGRFLMLREIGASSQPVQLQVVLGFADEVHRLVSEQQ